uniref:Delta-like protein n=1 Tax=Caenorhabditis tropicalis TaxID=1561998 RepID=A0A1I7TPX5_9PELO
MLSPLTVMFPFKGIKINVGCDSQWYGEKCDVFCCSETASRVGKVCNSLGQLGCPEGKRGLDCSQNVTEKWCKCKNQGKCVSSFGKNLREKMQCVCPVGFSGIHCEKEVDAIEMISTYGVDPKKFEIGTAKMLYESVVDNELVEVSRPHSSHLLHNLKINDA